MRVTIEGISQKGDDKFRELGNNTENIKKLNDSRRCHTLTVRVPGRGDGTAGGRDEEVDKGITEESLRTERRESEVTRRKRPIACPTLWIKIDANQAQKCKVSGRGEKNAYELLEKKQISYKKTRIRAATWETRRQ